LHATKASVRALAQKLHDVLGKQYEGAVPQWPSVRPLLAPALA